MQVPTPEEVRSALAELDERQHKLVGGVVAVMIKNPKRVRDREWITEQLTQVALLAGDFDAPSTTDGVEQVRDYLVENVDRLLNASFQLFLRVGEDLAPRVAEGFTYEEAVAQAMSYF